MKTLLILLLLAISVNCGPIEDLNQYPIKSIVFVDVVTPVEPPITPKATKYGQYFIDPINKNLCERRDDIPNKKWRYLEGKCLPIKTKKFYIDPLCENGSDRFFLDNGDMYISYIKITEQDGKFYKAFPINVPIKGLYTKKRECENIAGDSQIYVITTDIEVFPTFPNLP